jgi:transcriptional regulator with PAS, ATPase and Fis domain
MTLEELAAEKTLKEVKLEFIYEALKQHNWNRTNCANSIGISYRLMKIWVNRLRFSGYHITDHPRGYWSRKDKE